MSLCLGCLRCADGTAPAQGSYVKGELYEVAGRDSRTQLDELEQGYRKEVIAVRNARGEVVAATVYYGDSFIVGGLDQRKDFLDAGDDIGVFPPGQFWD